MGKADDRSLAEIRKEIDSIDEAMHDLLMRRSAVIDELIAIKEARSPGIAFRPGREAEMMRRFAMRHDGHLPLSAVEHIWREIISTFTAIQAPFSVVTGPAKDPLAMRDTARFYFGFSVPIAVAESSMAALEGVSAEPTQIAVVAADSPGAWWRSLCGESAPKIIARLPFFLGDSHPAPLQCYVAAPPLNDASAPDIHLWAASAVGDGVAEAVTALGGRITGRASADALIELPSSIEPQDIGEEIAKVGGKPVELESAGGFAAPVEALAGRTDGENRMAAGSAA